MYDSVLATKQLNVLTILMRSWGTEDYIQMCSFVWLSIKVNTTIDTKHESFVCDILRGSTLNSLCILQTLNNYGTYLSWKYTNCAPYNPYKIVFPPMSPLNSEHQWYIIPIHSYTEMTPWLLHQTIDTNKTLNAATHPTLHVRFMS